MANIEPGRNIERNPILEGQKVPALDKARFQLASSQNLQANPISGISDKDFLKADGSFDEAKFKAEVLNSSTPTIIEVSAPWCKSCQVLGETLGGIQQSYGSLVKVLNVDSSQNPAIIKALEQFESEARENNSLKKITSVPHLIFINDGKAQTIPSEKPVLGKKPEVSINGFVPEDKLKGYIKDIFGIGEPPRSV